MKKFVFIMMLLFLGVLVFFIGRSRLVQKDSKAALRVLLLGASVGKEWNFSRWPARMKKPEYFFEMVAHYSFDKREALDEILMRPKRKFRLTKKSLESFLKPPPKKPDVIILKECAAYFPGDLKKGKELIKQWISQCNNAGIKPVLATVVPVTKEHAREKPGRMEDIIEYNDWAREYAMNNELSCLDLEAALRIDGADRFLRPDLASHDGLHLNSKAYDILDKWLLDKLDIILK